MQAQTRCWWTWAWCCARARRAACPGDTHAPPNDGVALQSVRRLLALACDAVRTAGLPAASHIVMSMHSMQDLHFQLRLQLLPVTC